VGAVQKLATVVIIGLVALATVLTVYIADEPNRRDDEGGEQDVLAIERGTDLYIQFCLQCHGPDGGGAAGGDNRVGGVLNQSYYPDGDTGVSPVFQSDDPAQQSAAETFLRYRITYGAPGDPRLPVSMPAFGTELNVEEINDLVYLMMNGDWNYIYNESVTTTGHNEHDSKVTACEATPDLEGCDDLGEAVPAYPTTPPTAVPEGEDAATPVGEEAGPAPVAEIDATDSNQWTVTEVTAKPGDTIAVNNPGVIAHDFTVDEWGIADPLAGGAQTTITIPADAQPGTYTFYCSVPGHRQAGMEGTITITG
jgi:plastocyanin/mono/diheme cytochrome c family protein